MQPEPMALPVPSPEDAEGGSNLEGGVLFVDKKDWEKAKERLMLPFGSVKLIADGYAVTLQKVPVKDIPPAPPTIRILTSAGRRCPKSAKCT